MHDAALTDAGRAVFAQLHHFDQYYLAGGTALALQLGHRQSVDFDCFTDAAIPKALLRQVETAFSGTSVVPFVNNGDELSVAVGGVRLSFVRYPFPVLRPFAVLGDVRALGVLELAATKAYTIGRRGSLKDYVDVHAVLRGGHATLRDIIALAEEKYGEVFNGRLFLEQLVYLDDVEDEPIRFLGHPVARTDLASFFERAVRTIGL
ncbi:nucleotidyl transferase AbiEii/AbiGii toxin family protein [Candidatus Uhrbacteria bacterium]|nr:nucleotidyl transferase AbiEii/AbiGii toxin family protein [Candidatus Uhrbacteria bacterium]